MAEADLDRVLRFMRLMWSVDHGLHKVSKRMAASIGLTGPQRLAVRVIGRSPGITAGEVAEDMHLDPSTITGILRRLVDSRMIVRRTDRSDARRVRLELTARGKEVDRRSAGTIEAAVQRALAVVAAHEVDAASRVLTALAEELTNGRGTNKRSAKRERGSRRHARRAVPSQDRTHTRARSASADRTDGKG
jgi:DNA-binding MarR family transcriptional regulator